MTEAETMKGKRVPPHMSNNLDYEALKELVRHHIESFDHMVEYGLDTMLKNIKPAEVYDSISKKKLRIWFGNSELYPPQKERSSRTMRDALYPFECRQAKISYDGKFLLDVCFQYGDGAVIREKFHFGQFPIMLKSKHCHLRDADPKKLVSYKEESSEMGGYFILNGLERVVRLLILQKQNYPMSMVRNSFRDRKEGYTDKAVVIRCVREDQSGVTVKLYYLSNGSAQLGFWAQGKEYMLPVGVVLKGKGICWHSACGGERVKIILDEVQDLSLLTHSQCLHYIGKHFQQLMHGMKNESYSVVGDAVLKDYILLYVAEAFFTCRSDFCT